MATRLTPVAKIPTFAVIIRAMYARGQDQADALEELAYRGSWLEADQRRFGEVTDEMDAIAISAASARHQREAA